MEQRHNGGHARVGRGLRGVRGMRLRGSMAARSGVTTRGRQRGDRPSVSEPVFCDILENLPEGQPLETAMHPKRVRVLPATVPKNPRSESLWSSLEMIAPSTPSTSCVQKTPTSMPAASLSSHNLPAAEPKNPRSESVWSSLEMIAPSTPSTSCVQKTPPPMPATSLSPHNLPAAEPIILDDFVPSPALYVECNMSSGASTPNFTRPVSSRVRDRISNIRRPLRDDEISSLLNYGSEEESGEEEKGLSSR